MEQGYSLAAEQGMVLLPAALQSLAVLQHSAEELCAEIAAEFERNETLDVAEPDAGRRPPTSTRAGGDRDWLASLPDPHSDDLLQSLRLQLAWDGCPSPLADLVLELAGHLDDRGLLQASDAELSDALSLAEGELHLALGVLRSLEPRGLGSRSVADAMLCQVPDGDPDRDLIATLLRECLPDLADGRSQRVAARLDLEPELLESLVARVARLRRTPLALEPARSMPLRADLTAQLMPDGSIEVGLVNGRVPQLAVSSTYERMSAGEAGAYLRPKLAEARQLIRAVERRQDTLLAIGEAVMRRQLGYLCGGPAQLVPLGMEEVADELGLAPSTVSRAVAGKWIATPHGTAPLRAFFARPVGAGSAAPAAVMERIRACLAEEDPQRPLSDSDLVALLAADGLPVARRTVAKYRETLGIPDSHTRRRRYSRKPA